MSASKIQLLEQELRNLYLKIHKVDKELSTVEKKFWDNGGTCCTSCGIPVSVTTHESQEYREVHAIQIKSKIERMRQVPIKASYSAEELYPAV
jgi:hypothetical protein